MRYFKLSAEVKEMFHLPALPKHFFVEGGCARAVARYIINGDIEEIRDIDIVSIGNADSALAEELAKVYMPIDFARGQGVRNYHRLKDFFKKHDFTCNEVLLTSSGVLMTEECFFAISNNLIKPSAFELKSGRLRYKIRAKAKYLFANLKASGLNVHVGNEIEFIDPWKEIYAYYPYITFLRRALQRGRTVTALYLGCNEKDFYLR